MTAHFLQPQYAVAMINLGFGLKTDAAPLGTDKSCLSQERFKRPINLSGRRVWQFSAAAQVFSFLFYGCSTPSMSSFKASSETF